MKQYNFAIVEKNSNWSNGVRCTAPTMELARKQVVGYYGDNFNVAELPQDIRPAHYFLGEIDASDC